MREPHAGKAVTNILQALVVDETLTEYSDDRRICRGAPYSPLTIWANNHKGQLMMWIVQMGFELDIYQPDEMAAMYL